MLNEILMLIARLRALPQLEGALGSDATDNDGRGPL
jgi:hypothetical protein